MTRVVSVKKYGYQHPTRLGVMEELADELNNGYDALASNESIVTIDITENSDGDITAAAFIQGLGK